jgi:hypothetical protein
MSARLRIFLTRELFVSESDAPGFDITRID